MEEVRLMINSHSIIPLSKVLSYPLRQKTKSTRKQKQTNQKKIMISFKRKKCLRLNTEGMVKNLLKANTSTLLPHFLPTLALTTCFFIPEKCSPRNTGTEHLLFFTGSRLS